jgi:hypothetical protein
MRCYQHQTHEAIGVCRHCGKAVCTSCTNDTGHGIACSESCASEVDAMYQLNQKVKQIYSIGKKSRLPATGILFYLFFGMAFAGFGFFPLISDGKIEWFSSIMGCGFLAFGVLAYFRTRKLQINC